MYKLLLNSYYGKVQTMTDDKDIDYGKEFKSKKKRVAFLVRELNSYRRANRNRLEELVKKDKQLREAQAQLDEAKQVITSIHYAMQRVQKSDPVSYVHLRDEFRNTCN